MRQQVFRETGTLSPKDGHIFNGSSRIFQRREDIFVKTIFVFEYHLSEVFAHILVSIRLGHKINSIHWLYKHNVVRPKGVIEGEGGSWHRNGSERGGWSSWRRNGGDSPPSVVTS